MSGGTCDVCGRGEVAGVRCSAFGPVSWAYCRECLNKPAEPAGTFAYLFDDVSDNGDGLAEHVNQFFTWRDGKYLSWAAYREERRHNV